MSGLAAQLAGRLAREAEAVCRHYLSNGRRIGRYWLVGDVRNTPGRSLFVRLSGPESGPGAAGRWADTATGEYGDLLDLIEHANGFATPRDAIDEAQRFLGSPVPTSFAQPYAAATCDSSEAARRLFAASRPIAGTLAERYLRGRAITARLESGPLRFHPGCFYRPETGGLAEPRPALIAAVTDKAGLVRGVLRTWLGTDGTRKADIASPRRALGRLHGYGVRFGIATDIVAVGEGIETMLSIHSAMPELPVIAALSAIHLAELRLSASVQRLYIARDADQAGWHAAERLARHAKRAGIAVRMLDPEGGDFNDDLARHGAEALRDHLAVQIAMP